MIGLTKTLPQHLTGAGFTLCEKGRCLYLYRDRDHQGCIFIARLSAGKTSVLKIIEVAENHLKLRIGEIKRGEDGHKCISHACVICGEIRWVKLIKGKPRSLRCKSCAHWRGGKFKDNGRGYMHIHLPPDSPFLPMANSDGFVLAQRLVMAQHLGRCLYSWERVRIKNRISTDVRIENLRLISKRAELYGQPAGNGTWLYPSQSYLPVPYCAVIGVLVAR